MFTNKAFTLIELLVVVLIIGILAAIAVPQYQKAVAKSRFTQLLIASKAIYDAQQVYILANGKRSLDLSALDINIEGGSFTKRRTNNDTIIFDWGSCNISLDSERKWIGCSLKKHPYIDYSRDLLNKKQDWCCSTEKIGQELCQEAIPDYTDIWNSDSFCGTGGQVYIRW